MTTACKSIPRLSPRFLCVPHLALPEPGEGMSIQNALSLPLTLRTNIFSCTAQPSSDSYSDPSWTEFTEHASAQLCPLSGFILFLPLPGTFKTLQGIPLGNSWGEALPPGTPREEGQIGSASKLKKETALGADGRQQRVVLETIFQGNSVQKSQFHTAFKQAPSYLKNP